jgi:poly-gamma-glutamate capsule biosynthesis protein CapA/YwtB (metallophosphatase superfamily)
MFRRDFIKKSAQITGALAASQIGQIFTAPRIDQMTLTAVGDCIITRKVSNVRDPSLLALVKLLRDVDCAIGNCEMTFGDASSLEPTPKGADMNLICPSSGADELAWLGFDLMGCANNHAMDYGSGGLLSTLRQLERVGIAAAGTGSTLAQAAAPNYIDTPAGRVALVNCASSFPAWSLAEYARGDSNGRPGINPLRIDRTYHLEPKLFEQLREIDTALFPKASAEAQQPVPSKELVFLDKRFVSGTTEVLTTPQPTDVTRITEAIKVARRNANLVGVLIHEHSPARPGGFLQSFARNCIDAGANFFLGSGPHVLGGIEIYKGKPICYSLGNFFFQYETVRQIPAEVYEANNLDINTLDPSVSYDRLSTYFKDAKVWQSVVAHITFRNRQLKELKLYPITLGMNEPRYARGLPIMATTEEGRSILKDLSILSEPFGTTVETHEGIGRIRLAN